MLAVRTRFFHRKKSFQKTFIELKFVIEQQIGFPRRLKTVVIYRKCFLRQLGRKKAPYEDNFAKLDFLVQF